MNDTSLHALITAARSTVDSIRELEAQLTELTKPVFTDFSKLHQIHQHIHAQLRAETVRERRMYFVFIAAYLYSPASIIGDYPLKAGLRTHISKVLGRCKGEVSEMFAETKFRYEKVQSFREKIDEILAKYLHNDN